MIFVVILLSICLVNCNETHQTNDKLIFAQIVSQIIPYIQKVIYVFVLSENV